MERTNYPGLDVNRLCLWLSERMNGGAPVKLARIMRIAGGASAETFRFSARLHSESVDRDLILRRDPVGGFVERNIQLEYRVMEALATSPVPVPRVMGLELDPDWLERPFFVDEAMPGITKAIAADELGPGESSPEEARQALGMEYVEKLAMLHRWGIDNSKLSFLSRPNSGTGPGSLELSFWEELIRRNSLEPSPVLAEAFIWLRENVPRCPCISLVHGEYRPGNFLRTGTRITGVLDWEYAHLGDPTEDLGWSFLRWYRTGDLECGFFRRHEFLKRYIAISGISVDTQALRFWEMFSNMKVLAIILTGQRAFHEKKMDTVMLNVGKAQHLSNEIIRLLEI